MSLPSDGSSNLSRTSRSCLSSGQPAVDESYVAQLRRAASESADNHEIRATLGIIIRKFEARDNFKAECGVSEWRRCIVSSLDLALKSELNN
jgi:hypothetical protein